MHALTRHACSQAFSRTDDEMLEATSLDDVMLITWLKLGATFFGVATLTSMPLLVGLYASGEAYNDADNDQLMASIGHNATSLLDKEMRHFTIGNLGVNSKARLFSVFVLYFHTYLMCKLLSAGSERYAALRWAVDPLKAGVQMHTVMVSDVPVHDAETHKAQLVLTNPAQLLAVGGRFFGFLYTIVLWALIDVLTARALVRWFVVPIAKRRGITRLRGDRFPAKPRRSRLSRGMTALGSTVTQQVAALGKLLNEAGTKVTKAGRDVSSGVRKAIGGDTADAQRGTRGKGRNARSADAGSRRGDESATPPPVRKMESKIQLADDTLNPVSCAPFDGQDRSGVVENAMGVTAAEETWRSTRDDGEEDASSVAEAGGVFSASLEKLLDPDSGLLSRVEVNQHVVAKFARIFPREDILHVIQAFDTTRVDAVAAKLERAREQLDRWRLRHQAAAEILLLTSPLLKGAETHSFLQSTRRSAIAELKPKELVELESKVESLNEEFQRERRSLIRESHPAPAALIIFRRRRHSTIAQQVQMDATIDNWNAEAAPGPTDVVWPNLARTTRQRNLRTFRGRLVAAVMVVFFLLPVNSLKDLLTDNQSRFNDFRFGTTLFNILVALILIIFLVLGHIFSLLVSRTYGHVSFSRMDTEGASIYFWLLVLNVVIANITTEPIWNEIVGWTENLDTLGLLLTERLVTSSTLFMNFCMLRVAQSLPFELLHPPFHLQYLTKVGLNRVVKGERTHERLARKYTVPEAMPMHRVPAQMFLVFLLGTLYAVYAPLILPICALYFSLAVIFWKHNAVYHYRAKYANGGYMWQWLFNKSCTCMIITQIIAIGGMGVSDFVSMRLILIPLPIITFLFARSVNEGTLSDCRSMPLFADGDDALTAELRQLEDELAHGSWREYIPKNLRGLSGKRLFKALVKRVMADNAALRHTRAALAKSKDNAVDGGEVTTEKAHTVTDEERDEILKVRLGCCDPYPPCVCLRTRTRACLRA